MFLFLLIVFIVCVGGGYLLFKAIGEAIFGKSESATFVDKTTHVHHHYHDNRKVYINEQEIKNLKK
jgi:hypothetical protein